MIPQKIHYCWFGNNAKPELTINCLASWKKYFPNYEIVEWNEKNFNVNSCRYIKEAYEAGKYAFVSDYARFYILYHEGGLYFDTDVEVICSMDDILKQGAYMGVELNDQKMLINPGLGLAAEKNNAIYKEILEHYEKASFRMVSGEIDTTTVVTRVTDILIKYGLRLEQLERVQQVKDITIYPADYFCPLNYYTGKMNVTSNTRSIHHYMASWYGKREKLHAFVAKIIGNKNMQRLSKQKKNIINKFN